MKSIFTLLLLSFTTFCFAQKDTSIIVNLPNKKYNNKHKKPSDEENTIKIAPLGFTTGIFPVYYERVINDFFSVQGGIGLTGRNHLRNAFQSIDPITPTYPWATTYSLNDISDPTLQIGNRKANMGFLLSAQPRIYFDSEAPEEAFMGISYEFFRYNFSIPGMVYNSNLSEFQHIGSKKKEHENISDLMVLFGYQSVFERLSVEYSTAVGIRNVKGTKYVFGTGYDNSGSPITQEGLAPYKQTLFNYNLGIRVGYHF